jgi:predicted GNAT family N-acyltransferase
VNEAEFSIDCASWDTDSVAIRSVREAVFIIEQRVPENEEWDALDARSRHVLARDAAGRAIGTGRLTPEHRIGRMAVLDEWRGRGVGAALIGVLLEQARGLGYPAIDIHAQRHAIGFYEQFGFRVSGAEFSECDIPHRPMRLDFPPPERRPSPAPAERPPARVLQSNSLAQALAATLELLGDTRHQVAIFSRDLDPMLLDVPAALEDLKRIALSGRTASIRVLVQEPRLPATRGHRLIALAQRLPSLVQLRTPLEPADLALSPAFMLNDRGGYLLRPLASRYEGEGSSSAPGRHRELLRAFDDIWERSAPSVELRALDL